MNSMQQSHVKDYSSQKMLSSVKSYNSIPPAMNVIPPSEPLYSNNNFQYSKYTPKE